MKPEDCKAGMEVLYEPTQYRRFRGFVDAEPWQIGEGTWVTKLVGMSDAYLCYTGKSERTVHAAALARIEPYEKTDG